jgi:hypothetical protein
MFNAKKLTASIADLKNEPPRQPKRLPPLLFQGGELCLFNVQGIKVSKDLFVASATG